MRILLTGVAGFVGSFLCERLVTDGHKVIGIDNLNNYYDSNLKKERIENLLNKEKFIFIKGDISDKNFIFLNLKNRMWSLI